MKLPPEAIDASYAAMFAVGGVDVDDPEVPINPYVAHLYADLAEAALTAALPHLVESFNHLVDQAVFKVDGVHHFHGSHCLCGEPASARARSQTEHITSAVVTELAARITESTTP